jgi:hypothetical protein
MVSAGGQARYRVIVNGREGFIDYNDAKPLLATNGQAVTTAPTPAPTGAKTVVLGAAGGSPNEKIPIFKNATDTRELRSGKPGETGVLAGETKDMYRIVLDGKEVYIYKGSATIKP